MSTNPGTADDLPPGPRVHPGVERLAAYSWRLIVIAVVIGATLWLLWQLRLVVFPVVLALLLAVVLSTPARWLRRRGIPAAIAAWLVMVVFLGGLALTGWAIVPALVDEFSDLGSTIEEGIDDIQDWLVDDSPFDLSRRDLENLRADVRDAGARALRSNAGTIVSGVVLAAEIFAGIVLGLVISFFFVKDGERMQAWALDQLPPHRRDLTRRLAAAAWRTLAGYLRGSAMLGVVEAIAIGAALFLVGGGLVVPVMILTFFAAFVPFVGAIVAGIVAVIVALVTAGFTPALIIAAVALAVQQFDNDLLAPLVFGKTLQLHPVVILLSITAGASLIGVAGAFLAVPTAGVLINVIGEYRKAASDGSTA